MNDEFLYRMRQAPPTAFAARLRARLESQAVTRRLRKRQITLYTLIACLVGSTALALVVPGVRETARAVMRQVWSAPRSSTPQPEARIVWVARQPEKPAVHEMSEEQQRGAGNAGTVIAAASVAAPPAARGPFERYDPAAAKLSAVPRGEPVTEIRTLMQLKLMGARQTAAALTGAKREFQESRGDVRIATLVTQNNIAVTRFCKGEVDIAMMSRLITQRELSSCQRLGIDVAVVPIAHEALAVLTNSANHWVSALRQADLRMLFNPSAQSSIFTWNELDSSWPGVPLTVIAPRAGSIFSDTFSELVFETTPAEQVSAAAGMAPEELGLLQKLVRTPLAVTYVPYAAYLNFQQRASSKLLDLTDEEGVAAAPSRSSIADGSYALARPLLLLLRRRADGLAEDFIEQVLTSAERRLAGSAYLPLSPAETRLALGVLQGAGPWSLDSSAIKRPTAREILLQQVPVGRREQERARLESN